MNAQFVTMNWISATVEIDENSVERDKTIDTTEFVTMLNKYECWYKMRM